MTTKLDNGSQLYPDHWPRYRKHTLRYIVKCCFLFVCSFFFLFLSLIFFSQLLALSFVVKLNVLAKLVRRPSLM